MDLNSMRTEIDAIDDQLLQLFLQRMEIVCNVAQYKLQNNLPVFHPVREKEIVARMQLSSPAGMEDYTRTYFEEIMAISRSIQKRIIENSQK